MDSKYCYPGTNVLINKFGITDFNDLHEAERQFTAFRLKQLQARPITGNYDLSHLQSIHRHIFQDVFEWAGKIRDVNIAKGNTMFANAQYIKSYAELINKQLVNDKFISGLGLNQFSSKLAYYATEINILHPFREGNGRSSREFIRCLSQDAGYDLKYSKIPVDDLFNAFVNSVTDSSDLKGLFENHFIDNVRDFYKESFIKNASADLIEKLNDLKIMSSRTDFLQFNEINDLYKKLGQLIDNNKLLLSDPKFKLVSSIVTDFRTMNIANKLIGPDLSKNIKPDLEL